MSKYTPKQIEKYNRQKYMNFLDKISKNLFNMLKNENTTTEKFVKIFHELKKKFDKLEKVKLDGEYYNHLFMYIEKIYEQSRSELFDMEAVRSENITFLNRLQKLKNRNNYKKEKHKHSDMHEFS